MRYAKPRLPGMSMEEIGCTVTAHPRTTRVRLQSFANFAYSLQTGQRLE